MAARSNLRKEIGRVHKASEMKPCRSFGHEQICVSDGSLTPSFPFVELLLVYMPVACVRMVSEGAGQVLHFQKLA